MAGGAALATSVSPVMMKKADAAVSATPGGKIEEVKTVCTHCSVGCGIIAEVQNGVWTGQEPAFDHPFNKGAHCSKGAAIREHGHGERRLKYPTKLVDGKWKKISWDEVLAGFRQAQQRTGLPVSQIRRDVGHQQCRSPGAHLSLDHGSRGSQYLGLRGDDKLV
jgi:anaerobic selenocysteine-containing dehydrogenase